MASTRLPHAVGQSACLSLSDYAPLERYPMRSPLVVADYLASRVPTGGRFGEIGSGSGDVITCMRQWSMNVLSVEMMKGACSRLRSRGIDVACQPFTEWLRSKNGSASLAPEVDVWYWWVWPPLRSQEFLRELGQLYERSARRGIAYISFDGHVREDMAALPLLLRAWEGTVERLFFDEGGALDSGTEPSYTRPQLYRPGRWGIFHVARFELSGRAWRQRQLVNRTLYLQRVGEMIL